MATAIEPKNSLRRNAIYVGGSSRIYFDRAQGWVEVPEGNFLNAYCNNPRASDRANLRRSEGQTPLTEAQAEAWWNDQESVDKIVEQLSASVSILARWPTLAGSIIEGGNEVAGEIEKKRSQKRRSQAGKVGEKIMDIKTAVLNGSSKQIAWASRIQDEFIQDGYRTLDRMESADARNMRGEETKAKAIACCEATLKLAETQNAAAWWINGGTGRSFNLEMRAKRAEFGF